MIPPFIFAIYAKLHNYSRSRRDSLVLTGALSGKILQYAVGADLVSARIPGGDKLRPYYIIIAG